MNFYTVAEAAKFLRVNPMTVRRHIGAGRLPAARAGRSLRIRREDLEAFMQPVSGEIAPDHPKHAHQPLPARPLTEDDALWSLVGAATDAAPSDAARKHVYLDQSNSRAEDAA